MKKKYILKNKKRFMLFTTLILTFCIGLMFISSISATNKNYNRTVIEVKSGDTLWSIASNNSNGKDIRKYIYEIEKINNIKSGEIYAGTCLELP